MRKHVPYHITTQNDCLGIVTQLLETTETLEVIARDASLLNEEMERCLLTVITNLYKIRAELKKVNIDA